MLEKDLALLPTAAMSCGLIMCALLARLANAAALLVLALLIWCGYWLFTTIAEMRKNQDCALTGRTNCVRLNVPDSNR